MNTALLLSGGIDSTSLAYWKRPNIAMTIDYGQVSFEAELAASAVICEHLGMTHEVIQADCSSVGFGCMSGSTLKETRAVAPTIEWWPFRNQLIITIAAAKAVTLGVQELMIGSASGDERHRDGTAEFVQQMSRVLELQEGGLRLVAPALHLTTVELVLRSQIPPSLLAWSHSCHTASVSCGVCPGCIKSAETWKALSEFVAFSNSLQPTE